MNRSFWRGMLAGGIIGGMIGAMYAPTMRPDVKERWVERGRGLRQRAERLVRRATDELEETMEQ